MTTRLKGWLVLGAIAGATVWLLIPAPPRPDPELCRLAETAPDPAKYRAFFCTTDPAKQEQIRRAFPDR